MRRSLTWLARKAASSKLAALIVTMVRKGGAP
jgi:hypothetical protein